MTPTELSVCCNACSLMVHSDNEQYSVCDGLLFNIEIRCATKRGASPGEVCCAKLLLLFSYKTRGPVEPEVAFVRWLQEAGRPAHALNIRLKPFKFAKTLLPGIQANVLHTDNVSLESIIGPCYMQPDHTNSHIYYYNTGLGTLPMISVDLFVVWQQCYTCHYIHVS